jgi:hypothetical protein
MKMRAWLTVAVGLFPAIAVAQAAPGVPVPRPAPSIINARDLQPAPPAVLAALPDGSGAWVLQMTTSGGVMGTGSRTANFTVTSEGRLACEVSDCPGSLPRAELSGLIDRLARLDTSLWAGMPSVAEQTTLCRDCLRTTLILRRREGEVVAVYTASWDPTQKVAQSLRDLANEVRSLTRTPR